MRSPLFCGLVAGLAACVALPAGAVGSDAPPTAHAARKCGTVTTRNGGTARFIYGNKVRCTLARRVARGANGHKFAKLGFTCRPIARTYGCNKPGTSKGIGFSYHPPA